MTVKLHHEEKLSFPLHSRNCSDVCSFVDKGAHFVDGIFMVGARVFPVLLDRSLVFVVFARSCTDLLGYNVLITLCVYVPKLFAYSYVFFLFLHCSSSWADLSSFFLHLVALSIPRSPSPTGPRCFGPVLMLLIRGDHLLLQRLLFLLLSPLAAVDAPRPVLVSHGLL